ncbi:hypothetical protein N9A28_08140 [Sulfurimonas sp.]|nr:hypothetical protein [Sulfurimonas sp.]
MKYILTLLILISSIHAKQEDYSIIIDEPFNNALVDVVQNYDRTLTAVGFVKSFKTNSQKTGTSYTNAFDYLSSLSNDNGSQIHLVKVSNTTKIDDRKSLQLSNFSEATAITKTPKNGYFVGGYTLKGSLLIIKMDSHGNILFSKEFGTSDNNRLNNLVALRDGGVLAVGSSTTTRSYHTDVFESGLGLSDIYLTRFSSSGKQLWSKKYGTKNDDHGFDAVEASDSSIMVTGQTKYENFKNVILMRISEHGDKLWLNQYKSEKQTTPHKIIRLKDNNFLASLSEQDDLRKDQVRLLKFDILGNILIDKDIHTNYSSQLKDIKEYSNSNIIGVGSVKDRYNTDALSILLNSELDMLAQEHFGDENYDSFNRVTILNDSKAVAVGLNTNNNSQESNMWLVKLNEDLSISQVSPKSIDFYEALCELFKYEISSHKLEIKEDLSINLIDKALYFKTSEYKLTAIQEKFLKGFSTKLIDFMYKYKESINSFEINGHTSSEWAGVDFEASFLNNEKLSMNRSFSTLSYMYKNNPSNIQKWLSEILKGSGMSFSKKVTFQEKEDKEKSRRVSFKIILNK